MKTLIVSGTRVPELVDEWNTRHADILAIIRTIDENIEFSPFVPPHSAAVEEGEQPTLAPIDGPPSTRLDIPSAFPDSEKTVTFRQHFSGSIWRRMLHPVPVHKLYAGTPMKPSLVPAELVPDIVAECNASNATLLVAARLVGPNVEFTAPDAIAPEAVQIRHGDGLNSEPAAGGMDVPDRAVPEPLNIDAPRPMRPENLEPAAPSVEHPAVDPPLQIGLPLHLIDQPLPPPLGGTNPSLNPIRFECRPITVHLLHVDERRGQGYVLVGRAVRRVAIDGTIAQLRELRERVSASVPQLSTIGTFDVASCVSQPAITLDAADLLARLAAVDEGAAAHDPAIS